MSSAPILLVRLILIAVLLKTDEKDVNRVFRGTCSLYGNGESSTWNRTHTVQSSAGGLDARNYVTISFGVVWFIADLLLIAGIYTREPFLLLPWIVVIAVLTPMFVVAIGFASYAVHSCIREEKDSTLTLMTSSCLHEYHLLGSKDHVIASLKLIALSAILLTNILSAFCVHRFYRVLSTSKNSEVSQQVSGTVNSLAETTLSSVYRPRLHHHQQQPVLDEDDVDDDEQELCCGEVEVPQTLPLVTRHCGQRDMTPGNSIGVSHHCFSQHLVVSTSSSQ